MKPEDLTPEWARDTLTSLGYVKGRPLREYIAPDDWPACKLALGVLKGSCARLGAVPVLTGKDRLCPVVFIKTPKKTPRSRALPWAK